MHRGLVSALAAAWLSIGSIGSAQADTQQPTPPASQAPARPELSAASVISREWITMEVFGLETAGEPVVSGETAKGEAVLRAPLRLKREGRLAAEITNETLRMAAGAPVVYREFKPRAAERSEAIQAWCGPGEQRGMFGWAGGLTVCMVLTADGKANLGTPQLSFGSWWTAMDVSFLRPDARIERVAVEPVETPSVFNLVFVYDRLRDDGVSVRPAIEGPGMSIGGRPYRYGLPRRTLAVVEGRASLDYDGLRLSLTPERRGDVVAVTSQRVAPALDLAALRARAMVDNPALVSALERTSEMQYEDLDPTPFVIGGVKLDPAGLTVAQGVIGRGGTLLSGQAEYAVTARLTRPLNLRAPLINDTAPEGMILHQVEFARPSPLGTRTMTRIWCGPIGVPTVWSRERVTMCLKRGGVAGWEAFWPTTGRPWLGTTLSTGAVAPLQARGFVFETSPTSLLDPLGFRVELQRVTDKTAMLRLFARKGDQDAMILGAELEFQNGVATLPLWSHRLILTKSGEGMTAAFSADGDGDSPTEVGFYP